MLVVRCTCSLPIIRYCESPNSSSVVGQETDLTSRDLASSSILETENSLCFALPQGFCCTVSLEIR